MGKGWEAVAKMFPHIDLEYLMENAGWIRGLAHKLLKGPYVVMERRKNIRKGDLGQIFLRYPDVWRGVRPADAGHRMPPGFAEAGIPPWPVAGGGRAASRLGITGVADKSGELVQGHFVLADGESPPDGHVA